MTNLFFKSMIVAVSVLTSATSCRTTSPITGAKVAANSSANTPKLTLSPGARPDVMQWVVVTPGSSDSDEKSYSWNLDIRSGMEIWCETRCSEFKLDEQTLDDTYNVTIAKKTIVGNTNPGQLSIQKQIYGSRSKVKKVALNHVGVKGESIVLEDVLPKGVSNFYAVPMLLTQDQGKMKATFMDKVLDLELDSGVVLPEGIFNSPSPVSAFVFGTFKGGANKSFVASKVLAPWSGD